MATYATDYLNSKLGRTTNKVSDSELVNIAGFKTVAKLSLGIEDSVEKTKVPVESGAIMSDHTIETPSIITVECSVSESMEYLAGVDDNIEFVDNIFAISNKYTPDLTSTASSYYNQAKNVSSNTLDALDGVSSDFMRMYNLFGDTLGKNIKTFIEAIENAMNESIPIPIETPYKVYKDMEVVAISHNYDETNTLEEVAIRITLQEVIRVKTTESQVRYIENPTRELNGKVADKAKKGKNIPQDTDVTAQDALNVRQSTAFILYGGA
ncbi:phage baseplate protein [Francisella marina]|uniref:Dit-like phage tail protein N-terminal domain-containing protein n=1 Tax=Francisella marina TaxID=2249302 RepID=A0ABX5ZHL3_9GAMM|nr:hypothetical protein [Francisella marina]QEO57558.1 hypothetical protein F0R74_06720 [Francisella marina]